MTTTDNVKAFNYSGDQLTQVAEIPSGQSQVMTLTFCEQQGKYNVHKETYRRDGKQQALLFITDVSTMLRSEERKAWQALLFITDVSTMLRSEERKAWQALLFITDVSTMLRSEGRKAWQALVRVISHEINNSLSPITSISQNLKRLLTKNTDIEAHTDFLLEGLTVIAQRSNNLGNFVNSYKQIASLPEPQKQSTSIANLVNKVIKLYPEDTVEM
ncbi:MAG: hypothetical protein GY938_04075, partial [Ketobacter sp.]|nr:hypothetical protein [Ketobacter sp.]